MNINLTAAQAQTIIDAQSKEILLLTNRLRNIHVQTKYMRRKTCQLTQTQIAAAIANIKDLLDIDEGINDFNHDLLESKIHDYQVLLDSMGRPNIDVPLFTFVAQYATNGFNWSEANNIVSNLDSISSRALEAGELPTPDFFSSTQYIDGKYWV